jgi:menaquinone-specific isochorismate synthase
MTSGDDQRLAYELLNSDKDQLEHDIVRKSIRQKLHKFVDHLDVDTQASVLRLARKQHLCSEVQGKLKEGIEEGALLKRLHPTPAVGGYPTENALPEIARLEPFNRGWYAAPIGWIGANDAEFVVGIRSGLVEGNELSLFSGAGIVKGSIPDQEWEEVDNKIRDFVDILGTRT